MIYKFTAIVFHAEPGLISIDLGNSVLLKLPIDGPCDPTSLKGSTVTIKVEIPTQEKPSE